MSNQRLQIDAALLPLATQQSVDIVEGVDYGGGFYQSSKYRGVTSAIHHRKNSIR